MMLSAVEFGPFPHLLRSHKYLTEVQIVHSGSGNPVSALDFWKNKIDLCEARTCCAWHCYRCITSLRRKTIFCM